MDGCVTLLRVTLIFLTVRCSAEPPSYLPVQLHLGDQILSPFVEGGMTARNGAARQAAICRRGPKLLSATTRFKTKAREFLRFLISQSKKPICFVLGFFVVVFGFLSEGRKQRGNHVPLFV